MKLENLEKRDLEIDKSIRDMKERIEAIKVEVQNFNQQKQDEINKLTTTIVENQGRKKENLSFIDKIKKGESNNGSE